MSITRTFHPATKKILVATGITINNAPRSGCNNTSRVGSHTIQRKGINHSVVFQRKFLYFVQNAATDRIIESFKNSVGWSEKGTPGISNHHLAPFILTPNTNTRTSMITTKTLIVFTCFFHHRYGILIAMTIATRPIPAWRIFLSIKRQLFGSAMLPASTSLLVIRYESYTLTELIMTDQKSTRKRTKNKSG